MEWIKKANFAVNLECGKIWLLATTQKNAKIGVTLRTAPRYFMSIRHNKKDLFMLLHILLSYKTCTLGRFFLSVHQRASPMLAARETSASVDYKSLQNKTLSAERAGA